MYLFFVKFNFSKEQYYRVVKPKWITIDAKRLNNSGLAKNINNVGYSFPN